MAAFAATALKCGALADMNKAAIDVAKEFARLSELTIVRGDRARFAYHGVCELKPGRN